MEIAACRASKIGGNASRHDATDTDAFIANILHHRLRQAIHAEFRSTVCGAFGNTVCGAFGNTVCGAFGNTMDGQQA